MGAKRSIGAAAAIALLALLAGMGPVSSVSAAGVGLAPGSIEVKNALRGAEYEETILVMNPNTEVFEFQLSTAGEGGSWIRFFDTPASTSPVDRVTIPPAGKKQLVARLNIPPATANGTYGASIIVTAAAPPAPPGQGTATSTGGQSIAVQAQARVKIDVTGTQMVKANVTGIFAADTEINYPVRLITSMDNVGNVAIKPSVRASVFEGNLPIGDYQRSDTVIKPGSAEQFELQIGTRGWRAGDYTAKVVLSLLGPAGSADEVIRQEEVRFKVLPIGTLTRAGELRDLRTEGMAVVGNVMKLVATFRNAGEIETPATLVGEVIRNGALVGTLDSREITILQHEVGEVPAYYKLDQPGYYVIKAQVNYGGKLTDVRELSFQAVPGPVDQEETPVRSRQQQPTNNVWILFTVAEAAIVLAIIIGVFLIGRARRRPRRV